MQPPPPLLNNGPASPTIALAPQSTFITGRAHYGKLIHNCKRVFFQLTRLITPFLVVFTVFGKGVKSKVRRALPNKPDPGYK